MPKNKKVPAGPRAKRTLRWLLLIGGPPLAIALAYRAIPPVVRTLWNPRRRSSSEQAVSAILGATTARQAWGHLLHFAVSDNWD
jgi:hypothetical protein